MIAEARKLPPAMLALGAAMLAGFIVIAIAAIVSVDGSKSESPDIGDLALPSTFEIVDSHSTCDASACDGLGLVIDRDGMEVPEMAQLIVERLQMDGWIDETPCEEAVTCLKRDDLRIEVRPWLDLDEAVAPTMRASLEESGIDQSRLVYLSYYRCGVLRSCA
ncbi:MAG: hypothetical protein A2Z12_00150 [Actinobacteria bacterium RBG_16_68_21]|nr:MAG: hypothetical protein A2Z12_00150 [Actinobacteria bacterium RBG_16_68_21]